MATSTYTGSDATLYISGATHSTYAVGDFTINIERGTVEQELVCEKGNYFKAGALSVDGSFTAAKLSDTEAGTLLASMIGGCEKVKVSGNCGTNSLHFSFVSSLITGFDVSVGDSETISEASVDWTLKYPWKITTVEGLAGGGTLIKDH